MNPQVLIAEDDADLRSLLSEALEGENIRVVSAADGIEALEALQSNAGISVLVSDIRMPRLNGIELVEQALVLRPELKVLMMTGYVAELPPPQLLRAREIRTLRKPFNVLEMAQLVGEMLARS